ncbi:MAG: thiamine pyrophosphate-dependent enzyme [Tannerellaceae bacterium]|nr:thiamine pyrophosphate-dependent enzyme [Tannerellaceae bacterium]
MAKNIAEKLVDMLVKAGVRRIYAVTGDSLNHVNDAVRRNGEIEWIHVRHEETGAFAAAAEAQLHGSLACCAGSSGPGHVHLINGLYDAHRSGAPVLAITSTLPSFEMGTQFFQETNTIRLFDDCSHYNQIAVNPVQFPRMMQGAMQAAVSRRGVGVIGLPGDLSAQDEKDSLTSVDVFVSTPRVIPQPEEIARMAEVLNNSDKITLFCGIGAKEAHKELVELSRLLNAPVVYTFKSKMEIQYDNPNEVGLTGLLGMPSGYQSIMDAEVLLMLGTDFPYENFLPDDTHVIQVDINAERLGRRVHVAQGVCGDVKCTLQELLPLIRQKNDTKFLDKHLKTYEKARKDLDEVMKIKGKEGKISPEYTMCTVNTLAADDAIFTVDTGMTCVWGARYLQATGKRQMIGSFNHGSMANAMPQAIGAALAYPDRQVVALCGDGGLSMLLGDLATIVQYKLPVKLIVFNNRSLGMVKLEMEVAGLPDWQTDMYNPDFSRVAMSMGIPGYNVNDPEEVYPMLEKVFNTKGPVLVNINTDPDALAMPPKIEFQQMTGFAQAMYKLLIDGRIGEIKDTFDSNKRHIKEVF